MGLIGHHTLLTARGVIALNDNYALSNGFTTDNTDPNYIGFFTKRLEIDPTTYDWSQDFTLEFKFKANLFLRAFPTLLLLQNGNDFLRIIVYNNSNILIQSRVSGVIGISLYHSIVLGQEYHIILSLQRGIITTICKNGSFVSTANTLCPSVVSKAGYLGTGIDSNNCCLNGYQYDCRIYIGKAANNTEVLEMYNNGIRRDATTAMLPFLKSDYRLNQVNGNIALDRGLLENHGTLINYTETETQKDGGYWIAR